MGLFTKDEKINTVQTKESKKAGGYLSNLMQQSFTQPTQQIANLNPLTQQALANYAQQAPQINQYYQQAGNTLMGMAQGNDPYNSPYYENLRSEGERMKNAAGTDARQAANMGGALFSSPAAVAEANARSTVDTALLSTLGGLYQQDQQNQMAAASGLQQLGQTQAGQYQQQAQMGMVQQQQQQAQLDAIYNQALAQAIQPYQYQAQIAMSMYNPQTVVTGGGLGDFGAGLGAIGGFMQGLGSLGDKK